MKYKEYNEKSENRCLVVAIISMILAFIMFIFTIVMMVYANWIGCTVGVVLTIVSFIVVGFIDEELGQRDIWGSRYCVNGHWNKSKVKYCTGCGLKLKRKILYCVKCKKVEKYEKAEHCGKCGGDLKIVIEDID